MSAVDSVGGNVHTVYSDCVHMSGAESPVESVASSVLTYNYFSRLIVSAATGMSNLFSYFTPSIPEKNGINSEEKAVRSVLVKEGTGRLTVQHDDCLSSISEDGFLDDYELYIIQNGKRSRSFSSQFSDEQSDYELSYSNAHIDDISELAEFDPDQLTDEQIELALSDPDAQKRINAISILAEYAPDRLKERHIDGALYSQERWVKRDVFCALIKHAPAVLTDRHIDYVLSNDVPDEILANRETVLDEDYTFDGYEEGPQKDVFCTLVKHASGRLTVEHINRAISSDNNNRRKEAFSALFKHAVLHLTKDHINRALSDHNPGVRKEAFSALVVQAGNCLADDDINRALSDENASVRKEAFYVLAAHASVVERASVLLKDEHINRALSDHDPDVRKDAFDTLVYYAPYGLTSEHITRVLTDADPAVRKAAVYDLAKGAPDRLSFQHIDRALSDDNEQVRGRALEVFCKYSLLTDYSIESLVFPADEFNLEAYSKLPFAEDKYLQVGCLNELPPEKLNGLDGYLLSALPDDVLESLNACVLSNLTDFNKAKIGMRVFSKLSDEAFRALDQSVLGHKNITQAMSTNPQAFFDMPEWRRIKIAENVATVD